MHYTQEPSKVTSKTNSAATVLDAHLQGFITGPMLRGELEGWDTQYGEQLPSAFLLDLRSVSGYGAGTPRIARDWLLTAHERGVQRIAFVASSSVIRTIVRVISPDAKVLLRCFPTERSAIDWLEGRTATPRNHDRGGELRPTP
jgi:hypothetical protein